jgi:uncharacterized protein with NRDE domain
MCLILFAYDAHPEYRLVLAANRDEFYERPTAPAAPWEDDPRVVAGRDLRGGGTWMGITREGRWSALTNFRDPRDFDRPAPSRGHLVADFLRGEAAPEAYLASLRPRAGEYNGFNLLVGDPDSAWWFSNRGGGPGERLSPGVHGLSNHLLDTPWPKVERGRRALGRLLEEADALEPDLLLELLLDRTFAADHELPDTGVGRERERMLSSLFIVSPDYGTRSSSALLIDRAGRGLLVERTYERGGPQWSERRHEFHFEC